MSRLNGRVSHLEERAGLTGPGCGTCRPWGDVQIVDHISGERDAWTEHDGRCPDCGRTPSLTRVYEAGDKERPPDHA